MKPERIGLTTLDLGLYEWIVILKTGMQAVRIKAMMNEHLAATEHFVKIREDEWSFQDRRGSVDALIPTQCNPTFSELAVLACPGTDKHEYAARIVQTDDWAHFYYLQPWMQPFMEHYLTTLDRYSQIVELVAKTHRLTQ